MDVTEEIQEILKDFPQGTTATNIRNELASRMRARAEFLGERMGRVPDANGIRYKLTRLEKFGYVERERGHVEGHIWYLTENAGERLTRSKPDPTKWYPFDPAKGSNQKRPPIKRMVLVAIPAKNEWTAPVVAVGYRKDAAGDKQSPFFVIPGVGGVPSHWCDCLGDNFQPPVWKMNNKGD